MVAWLGGAGTPPPGFFVVCGLVETLYTFRHGFSGVSLIEHIGSNFMVFRVLAPCRRDGPE
jgi:hypothetical protein